MSNLGSRGGSAVKSTSCRESVLSPQFHIVWFETIYIVPIPQFKWPLLDSVGSEYTQYTYLYEGTHAYTE